MTIQLLGTIKSLLGEKLPNQDEIYMTIFDKSEKGFKTCAQFGRNPKNRLIPRNCRCFLMVFGTGKLKMVTTLEEEKEIPTEL